MRPPPAPRRARWSSPASTPARTRCGWLLELQRLGLEVLLETELAQLPPVPGLLVAAEGGEGVEAAPVDVHLAGPDAPGDALGPLGIGGPHRAGQPVNRVVGDLDRLVLGVVG